MLVAVRRLLIVGFLIALTACGGSGSTRTGGDDAAINDPDTPQPLLGTTVSPAPMSSAITGVTYPIHIYLPPGYAESDATYPVIYATDGQWDFDRYARIIDKAGKNIVLVAIEQGPEGRRGVDYLLPGARDFFLFLTSELLPRVEADYRINTEQRTLAGGSYGGVFVGAAMLLDDVVAPTFNNYFAFDPSFWQHPELTEQLEQSRYHASQELAVNLLLTSATIVGNDHYVTQMFNYLVQRDYSGLTITRRSYNVTHEDINAPSFRDAVATFF